MWRNGRCGRRGASGRGAHSSVQVIGVRGVSESTCRGAISRCRENRAPTLSTISVEDFICQGCAGAWGHDSDDAPAARPGAARSGAGARRAACGRSVRARRAPRGRRPPAHLPCDRPAGDVRGRRSAAAGDQEPAGHDPRRAQLPRRARGPHPRRLRRGAPPRPDRRGTGRRRPRGRHPPAARAAHPPVRSTSLGRHHPRDTPLSRHRELEPGRRAPTRRLHAAHALRPRPRRDHTCRRVCRGHHLRPADRPAAPGRGPGAPRAPARDGGRRRQGLARSRRDRRRRARPRRSRAPAPDRPPLPPRHPHPGRARHGDPQRPPSRPRREARPQAALPRGRATQGGGGPGRPRRAHGRCAGRDPARQGQRTRARDPRRRRDHHRPGTALSRARRRGVHRGIRPGARRSPARRAARSPRRTGGPSLRPLRP